MTAHPVDRLHEVRVQIEALLAEAETIRQGIIAGEISPIGEEWKAVIAPRMRRTIQVGEAEQLLPPSLFDKLCHHSDQRLVKLRRLGRNAPSRKRR